MKLIMPIFKVILISLLFLSCKAKEEPVRYINAIHPTIELTANTKLDSIYICVHKPILDNIIKKKNREIHLLRLEIDKLKKEAVKKTILKDINKLQDDLNKITQE